MEKSLLDYAYEFVSKQKKATSFAKIWNYVVKEAGLSEEEASAKISRFYTSLCLDGRFVSLGNNDWDLRERHTYDEAHEDMGDAYSDVETGDDDEEETADEEYKEYNEVFDEHKEESDEEPKDLESDEEL